MSLEKINGIHSVFYYYGISHLLISLGKYVQAGLHNKELIALSIDDDTYYKLTLYLNKMNINTNNLIFSSQVPYILAYKQGGSEKLKNLLRTNVEKRLNMGYSSVRWISQPSYTIDRTSKKDFLNWETVLTDIIKSYNLSLLCIYDFYDYINNKKTIDDEIIKESKLTHSNILMNFDIEPLVKNEFTHFYV